MNGPSLHRGETEEGFTLIELMVVVLIIGILVAIGLPVFLGAKTRAEDRSAEVRLRTAVTAAKTQFTDNNTYATVTPASLATIESSLRYNTLTPAVQSDISVRDVGTAQIMLATKSGSGKFMCIADNAAVNGLTYGTANADTFVVTTDCVGGW